MCKYTWVNLMCACVEFYLFMHIRMVQISDFMLLVDAYCKFYTKIHYAYWCVNEMLMNWLSRTEWYIIVVKL